MIHDQPDATLAELRQCLNLDCSLTAIWRTLRQLRITRKEKVLHHQERDSPKVQRQRRAFDNEVATLDPEHLVFVDESGGQYRHDPYLRPRTRGAARGRCGARGLGVGEDDFGLAPVGGRSALGVCRGYGDLAAAAL